MEIETLKQAIELSNKLGHVFLSTADASGVPHIAAAGKIIMDPDGLVEVTAWFCPGTVGNLHVNPRIALVVWDAKSDTGYQLIGTSEKTEELHMINGYAPGIEGKSPAPQVERKLTIRVDKIIDFKHAPHTDVEK